MKFGKAALAAMVTCWAGLAHAAPDMPEIKPSSHTDVLTLGGDLRLRNEYFDHRDAESVTTYQTSAARKNDRNRQRFRLRLKADWKLHDDLQVVAGLASGGGEAVSTNQSFSSAAAQKQIWIDLAYAKWAPKYLGENGSMSLMGGRMATPIWKLYTSDLVWDGDFNPEGFAESFTYLVADTMNVFANFQQAAMSELSGSPRDAWALSEQVGFEVPLPAGLRFRGAGAKHTWLNENSASLGQNPVQLGNTRSNTGILRNEYDVMELTGQLSGWLPIPGLEINLPWMIQTTFIKNLAARGPDWSGTVTGSYIKADGKTFLGKSDQGIQVGVQLGKVGGAGSWEVAYYYKRAAWDATVADVADSDFGEGGLNRKGNIGWISYSPNGSVTATVKVFNVRLLDKRYVKTGTLVNVADKINRVQADLSIKF